MAQIVVLVALGLLATTTSRLVQNALYAIGDAKGPAAIAAVRVVVAAAVGVVLMFQLDRIGLVGPGIDGLLFLERPPAPLAPLSAAARTDGALRLGAVGLAAASGTAAWLGARTATGPPPARRSARLASLIDERTVPQLLEPLEVLGRVVDGIQQASTNEVRTREQASDEGLAIAAPH